MVVVRVELTPWRESTPPGMWLRDWCPRGGLPHPDTAGDPNVRGAAAAVRDEYPVPGWVGDRRWSWRVWIPIGTVWPWRSGGAATREDAQAMADAMLQQWATQCGAVSVTL